MVKPTACRLCGAKHWSYEDHVGLDAMEPRESITALRKVGEEVEAKLAPAMKAVASNARAIVASVERETPPAASSRRAKSKKAASEVRSDVESASDGRDTVPFPVGHGLKVDGSRCRCGHEWIPKGEDRPAYCPKCKSRKWDEWTEQAIAALD